MTQTLPSLVALTLLLSGAVAAVPLLVADPQPRPRPPLAMPARSERLWIVEGPGDRWFLNGVPIARARLEERLRRHPGHREVRFLPSAALPMGRVAGSLRWLRERNQGPVGLELPSPPR